MIFQVRNEQGFSFQHNNMNYTFPYLSTFEAERKKNTRIILSDFNPNIEIDINENDIIEIEALYDSFFNIFSEFPVNVYSDEYLKDYSYTIPKNTNIQIKKSFSSTSTPYLSTYLLYNDLYIGDMDHLYYYNQKLKMRPLSKILMARILSKDGVIVRRHKEMYSPIIGILPYNQLIFIKKKDVCRLPSHDHTFRLQLLNEQGWINYNTCDNLTIDIIGYCKDEEPINIIDLDNTSIFIDDSKKCIICLSNDKNIAFLHDDHAHNVVCKSCSNKFELNDKCPICRKRIEKKIILF